MLLEWKRQVDRRGHESWAGLVVYALLGVGMANRWEVRMTWMDATALAPVVDGPLAS